MLLLGALVLSASALPVGAQGAAGAGLSRQMSMAIDFYEKGQDLEAMDRFMEILVKGNPAERPMANEYLNLISQRMSIGGRFEPKEPPAATVIEEDVPVRRGGPPEPSLPERSADAPPPRAPERVEEDGPRTQGSLSKSDRAVMKREIEAKIRNRTRMLVEQLRKYQDLRVRMANARLPRAIGVPAEMLFDSGTRFKKDSAKVLRILEHLVFSLGATQIVILPERAVLGDSKILDMRRSMGISSHLLQAGIAPSRVRVNLLSSQVSVPRDLQDFTGILILFVYNQPLELATDSAVDAAAGPPLSLGSSPGALDPAKGEGVILEFSVMEPPAGLMSWRFQLLGPGTAEGDDLVPLQEVKGSAPVFHQIYWNARERYFGRGLPPGRYEAVLTATDMRNRSRKLHSWITVRGRKPEPAAPPPAAAAVAAKPPPAELPGATETGPEAESFEDEEPAPVARKEIAKRPPRRRRPRRKTRRPAPKVAAKTLRAEPSTAETPAAEPAAAPPEEEAPARRTGAVNYQVAFQKGTPTVTPEGESVLGRVADTMHYYPLDNINLVGYAYAGEGGDPETLAARRAQLVKNLLVERHGMKPERIRSQTKVVDREAAKVEIYIVAGGP